MSNKCAFQPVLGITINMCYNLLDWNSHIDLKTSSTKFGQWWPGTGITPCNTEPKELIFCSRQTQLCRSLNPMFSVDWWSTFGNLNIWWFFFAVTRGTILFSCYIFSTSLLVYWIFHSLQKHEPTWEWMNNDYFCIYEWKTNEWWETHMQSGVCWGEDLREWLFLLFFFVSLLRLDI